MSKNRPNWRWTIRSWRSSGSRWGVELLRRPRWKHSQVRVHMGRRHWTLMAISYGQAPIEVKD